MPTVCMNFTWGITWWFAAAAIASLLSVEPSFLTGSREYCYVMRTPVRDRNFSEVCSTLSRRVKAGNLYVHRLSQRFLEGKLNK